MIVNCHGWSSIKFWRIKQICCVTSRFAQVWSKQVKKINHFTGEISSSVFKGNAGSHLHVWKGLKQLQYDVKQTTQNDCKHSAAKKKNNQWDTICFSKRGKRCRNKTERHKTMTESYSLQFKMSKHIFFKSGLRVGELKSNLWISTGSWVHSVRRLLFTD